MRKQVLDKAVGTDQATAIINRLTSSLQVRPFDFVGNGWRGRSRRGKRFS